MLVRKVLGKWKGVRWVTEDGHVFKFKRKLKKPSVVFVICANKLNLGKNCWLSILRSLKALAQMKANN